MQSELKSQIAQVHGRAQKDALTGVKNKYAYQEAVTDLAGKMDKGEVKEFAITVCDVNGLKRINDTLGHSAGDEYIRKACMMICDIFSHSPVYRIGGDEFVVIMTGRDYDRRISLMNELHGLSSSHISTDEAVVSSGMAEYLPDRDRSVREIFERADAAMYKDKMVLKSLGAVTRDGESDSEGQDGEDITDVKVRKHILIADDIESNREILGDLLKDDYDIFYAKDGVETMEMLREHKDDIALLLLDLYMPGMTGREVMKQIQVDEELMHIPVIMLTVDHNAELDSLRIGAMDFISKPYPDIDIVKARIAKCIELSENRALIKQTENDKLTGLYNTDYFIRYVKQLDRLYKDTEFDAFVCEINNLHQLNEKYGRQFGDLVIRSVGISMRKLARKTGGIGCRKDGDTFLMYCPHRDDYDQLTARFRTEVFLEEETGDKVSLSFGVYPNAGREADIEERFEKAQMAADTEENMAEEENKIEIM